MKILFLGGSGFLGRLVVPLLAESHEVVATSTAGGSKLVPLDIRDERAVGALLDGDWDLVIHAAALVDLDACERAPELAESVNVNGAENVSRHASCRVLFVSTDYVFGDQGSCDEETPPSPLSVYGETKLRAESAVLAAAPDNVVVRLPFLYGFTGGATKFMDRFAVDEMKVMDPVTFTPLYAPDFASAIDRLVQLSGIVHFPGGTTLTRLQFFRLATQVLNLSTMLTPVHIESVEPRRPSDMTFTGKRLAFRARTALEGLSDLRGSLAANGQVAAVKNVSET